MLLPLLLLLWFNFFNCCFEAKKKLVLTGIDFLVPSKKSFFDEKVETRNWLRIGEIGGKWGKENQDEREREDKRGGWRVRVCE